MIAVIDYGAGNTRSVMNALDRLGVDYTLTNESNTILSADKVIFPGVGHAGHAMQVLKAKGLDLTIQAVCQPLLGICVGMQLLYEYSEEGNTSTLGIIEGKVMRFKAEELIVPQMGWSSPQLDPDPLFSGLADEAHFYSVHSYYAEQTRETIGTGTYGVTYAAAVKKDNFYGVQFHPEKSSKAGSLLLKNFIEL